MTGWVLGGLHGHILFLGDSTINVGSEISIFVLGCFAGDAYSISRVTF